MNLVPLNFGKCVRSVARREILFFKLHRDVDFLCLKYSLHHCMFLYEDFTVTVKEWFFCILAEFCLISPCTNYLVYYAARFSACVQKRAHSGDLTRYLQTLDGLEILLVKQPGQVIEPEERRISPNIKWRFPKTKRLRSFVLFPISRSRKPMVVVAQQPKGTILLLLRRRRYVVPVLLRPRCVPLRRLLWTATASTINCTTNTTTVQTLKALRVSLTTTFLSITRARLLLLLPARVERLER